MNTTEARKRSPQKKGIAARDSILRFAESYIRRHGYAPSVTEIGKATFYSRCTVAHHLKTLRAEGAIVGAVNGRRRWITAQALRDLQRPSNNN